MMPEQTWSVADNGLTVTKPDSTGQRVVAVFESAHDAARAVFAHEQYPRLIARIVELEATEHEGSSGPTLTARERQVLALVAEGRSGAGIAMDLGVAKNTVAQHLNSARRKYGVRTSRAAADLARRDGQLPATAAAGAPS